MSLLEKLFESNNKKIQKNVDKIRELKDNNVVSGITYNLVECTLAEAQAFNVTGVQLRFITNARKSGEGASMGTGLPAFYDAYNVTPQWVDFLGNPIQV